MKDEAGIFSSVYRFWENCSIPAANPQPDLHRRTRRGSERSQGFWTGVKELFFKQEVSHIGQLHSLKLIILVQTRTDLLC